MREETKELTKTAALRSIAVLEAVKGIVVLLVAFGLLRYLHRDVGDAAENLVRHLHVNPAHHLTRAFLEAADKVADRKLIAIVIGAFAYTTVRFVESYGLWHKLAWAEWFALLSGGLYLPWEIYELAEKATPVRASLFGINVAVILYMVYIRWSEPAHEI
jgi:uncharacterized membrane protein (DUF2068 family)